MAYALQFDGSGYTTSATLGDILSLDSIAFHVDNAYIPDTYGYIVSQAGASGGTREFGLISSFIGGTIGIQLLIGGVTTNIGTNTALFGSQTIDGDLYARIDFTTNQLELKYNNIPVVGSPFSISVGAGRVEGVLFRTGARSNSDVAGNTSGSFLLQSGCRIGNVKVLANDVELRNLNADASDHSGSTDQPILTDTVGSNDATGIGFPSFDASVWINLGGAVTAAISGTITPTSTEVDIVNGGKTIIITLTDDTWQPSGIDFDNQRQSIIDGLVSAQSELLGWNNEVRDNELVTSVVRTSDTVVTITLSAAINYDITSDEVITTTVPSSALVTSTSDVVGDVTFTITPTVLGFNIAWATDSNELIY